MRDLPPIESVDWIARQEGCSEKEATERRTGFLQELSSIAQRLLPKVSDSQAFGSGPPHSSLPRYQERLAMCVNYHWLRFAEHKRVCFTDAISRLGNGELEGRKFAANLLFDVVFAVSLEMKEPGACQRFDNDYMALVRAIASRKGGERSVEDVENFLAELITPRPSAQPRIASYSGKSPFVYWLGSVVSRFCVDMAEQRARRQEEALPGELPHETEAPTEKDRDHRECEQLLGPVFRELARELDPTDSLMFKMVYLDGVSQKRVAEHFGVHSGNLTRRKQRVAKQLNGRLEVLARDSRNPVRLRECLEEALVGDRPQLKRAVADIFAAAVRPESQAEIGEIDP